MRRRDPLPPAVARELEDLDAALAGAPGADPELTALAHDVRALRAEPDPAFLASLDARVLTGFAGEREDEGEPRRGPVRPLALRPRARRPRSRLRAWAPAMGAAASLALVVAIVAGTSSGGPGGDNGSSSNSAGGGSVAAEAAKGGAPNASTAGPGAPNASSGSAGSPSSARDSAGSSSGSAGSATAVAPAPPLGPVPGGVRGPRRVERGAQLQLSTSADEVQDVADGVVRTTQAVGGYVAQSQTHSGDESAGASFTLRIPSRRLDDALARLSKLAHVRSLDQGATDITGSFSSVARRLGDTRAERRALLRALGRATTDQEIATLRARLRLNRAETERLERERAQLHRRADLATVGVGVEGSGKRETGGGAWTPGDALRDAARVLEVAAGVALIALAAAVPLALLALLGLAAARAGRRRRREAALDGA